MKSIYLFLAVACAACGAVETGLALTPSRANQTPDELDGQLVVIEGWFTFTSGEHSIWDSKADRDDNSDAQKCLSVLVPQDQARGASGLSGKMVRVTGRFHKSVESFKSTMFFALCNITAIEIIASIEDSIEEIEGNAVNVIPAIQHDAG